MNIVTRFAPSPTGVLHTGSARTALYNWLFSRHNKGKFLLRIEDTDKERSKDEHTQAIIRDLKWLGLDWDGEIVYQSQNIERHKEVAHELLKGGKAYNCYCSEEETEEFRRQYPNQKFQSPWRDKSESEAPIDGKPVVRIKVERSGQTVINDLIQGEITIANQELDDMVLLRSDGSPTYMLAVVVDDHDMNITHIIRGDDHLTNAFRQKQIYQAMGWQVPEFAHIPLIHDKEGRKLSKREGAMGIDTYLEHGYLPEAVVNHLLRLGWGHGNDEIITSAQAVEWFTLEGVGKSPARFDREKLNFINAHYLRAKSGEELYALIMPFLKQNLAEIYKERIIRGMDGLKQRAETLVELAECAQIYVAKKAVLDEKSQHILSHGGQKLLQSFAEVLIKCENWDKERLQELGNDYAASHQIKSSIVMQSLRAGVLGTFAAPGIYEVMEILGKEETLARLKDVIA